MSIAIFAAVGAIVVGLAWWRYLRAPAPAPPVLSAPISRGVLNTPNGPRSFALFVPASSTPGAPLLLALHGSAGDAEQMRKYTGYEFERLADEHGFNLAYPEGYKGYWNDARRKGGYAAKRLDVDDVGFLRDLVQHLRATRDIGAVFVAGYSNGGQMCLRLALEASDVVDRIAVFATNMPTDDNCVSPPTAHPVDILFVNGTRDPINPYDGGRVTIFGFGDRGTVHSAMQSAEHFSLRLGPDVRHDGPTVVVAADGASRLSADRHTWSAGSREVVLLTVHGGGHVVPQPHYTFPRFVGPTEVRLNAPRECWTFFTRSLPIHTTR